MGFWSGFEGLTGHTPGAFKGFSLKDIIDKDMWERRERLGGRQSRQFEQTGVVPETAWYTGGGTTGRGRPEMMGPRVGAADAGVRENRLMDESPDMFAGVNQGRFDATTLANQQRRNALWGSGPATVSAARPWPNIQAQMLGDTRQGAGSMRIPPAELMGRQPPPAFSSPMRPEGAIAGPRPRPFQMSDMTIPPAELMGDKKTVREIFADPTKSDKITETITQKVPMGDMRIPTSELMGGPTVRREHSGYFPPPPNWLERTGFNPGYFGRPASIMDMRTPTSELAGGRDEDRIREMFRVLEGMRARRGY